GPRSRPETTEVMGANRSQPQTIRSSAPVTAPWPPAAGRDTPGPASKKARRWPFLLIPVFLVFLIPVVAGGIWLLTTYIVGSGSERKWLNMLARGQVNV